VQQEIYHVYNRVQAPRKKIYKSADKNITWVTGNQYQNTGWSASSVRNSSTEIWKEIKKFTNETRNRCISAQKSSKYLNSLWKDRAGARRFYHPQPICWPLPNNKLCDGNFRAEF